MMFEKYGNQTVPFLLQRLIHGEGPVGNSGGTGEFSFGKTQIQKHPCNLLRPKTGSGFLHGPFLILRRQLKYKPEGQGRVWTLDQMNTHGPKQSKGSNGRLPDEIIGLVFRTVVIRIQMPVNGVIDSGADGSLRQ